MSETTIAPRPCDQPKEKGSCVHGQLFECPIVAVFPDRAFKVEGEGINRSNRPRYFAGYVLVPAGTEYRQTYETAAWHTTHATTETRWYPVWATKVEYDQKNWSLWAEVDAVITDSFTPSLFGGVMVGSTPQGRNHRDVGRVSTFHFKVTPQMVAVGQEDLPISARTETPFIPATLGFSARTDYFNHGGRVSAQVRWEPYTDPARWPVHDLLEFGPYSGTPNVKEVTV